MQVVIFIRGITPYDCPSLCGAPPFTRSGSASPIGAGENIRIGISPRRRKLRRYRFLRFAAEGIEIEFAFYIEILFVIERGKFRHGHFVRRHRLHFRFAEFFLIFPALNTPRDRAAFDNEEDFDIESEFDLYAFRGENVKNDTAVISDGVAGAP